MDSPSIAIVGPGRLGGSVAARLNAVGWRVTVIGRGEPIPVMPVTWLTVPDAEIAARALDVPPGGLVIHSAGCLGPDVLSPHRGAVLHPLMTFPPPHDATIPCTADGHPDALAAAVRLAQALGWHLHQGVVNRPAYHAAACLASGHLAACFAEASHVFAASTGVSAEVARSILAPLAQASLARVVAAGAAAISGPAVRGDVTTIAAHRATLPPGTLPLYDAGTAAIQKLSECSQKINDGVKSGDYS